MKLKTKRCLFCVLFFLLAAIIGAVILYKLISILVPPATHLFKLIFPLVAALIGLLLIIIILDSSFYAFDERHLSSNWKKRSLKLERLYFSILGILAAALLVIILSSSFLPMVILGAPHYSYANRRMSVAAVEDFGFYVIALASFLLPAILLFWLSMRRKGKWVWVLIIIISISWVFVLQTTFGFVYDALYSNAHLALIVSPHIIPPKKNITHDYYSVIGQYFSSEIMWGFTFGDITPKIDTNIGKQIWHFATMEGVVSHLFLPVLVGVSLLTLNFDIEETPPETYCKTIHDKLAIIWEILKCKAIEIKALLVNLFVLCCCDSSGDWNQGEKGRTE